MDRLTAMTGTSPLHDKRLDQRRAAIQVTGFQPGAYRCEISLTCAIAASGNRPGAKLTVSFVPKDWVILGDDLSAYLAMLDQETCDSLAELGGLIIADLADQLLPDSIDIQLESDGGLPPRLVVKYRDRLPGISGGETRF